MESLIHDSHEIAILEFPTSDCSQNEAWCHAKRTDVTPSIENTWRRRNQHCKFNALVARTDDHSILFNYAAWARCHHTVLNWLAILSERFVWCLKMTFNTRYRWKHGATHVQCDIELAAPSLTKSPIKSVFVSILLFHGKCDWNNVVLDCGTWHGLIWMVTLSTHVRFNSPRQLTTLTIRPHRAHASRCRWFSARLQWLQCASDGVTAVLYIYLVPNHRCQVVRAGS